MRGGSPGPIVDAVTEAFARIGEDRPFRSTMQAIVLTARLKERIETYAHESYPLRGE
jgi:hypothetical protein